MEIHGILLFYILFGFISMNVIYYYTYLSLIIKLMNIFIKVLKIINQNLSKISGPSTFRPI